MYLIVAICLLCTWVAPYACRSVEPRDPPSEELEPLLAHHHHDGNIAELLIPLLERSLAQADTHSNEPPYRRNKGKKVIQVLPYRGSEEHKRKGWRKLNSHKKQVVEITPLHGKDHAKPLAYILSAAKPSHGEIVQGKNNDVSSVSASDDVKTSEEQSSEETNEDLNVNRSGGNESDPQSDENSQTEESSAEDSEIVEKPEIGRKVVIIGDSEDAEPKPRKHAHKTHKHKKEKLEAFTAEEPVLSTEVRAFTAEEFTTEAFTTEAFTTEAFTTEAFTTEAFTTEAFTTEAFTTEVSENEDKKLHKHTLHKTKNAQTPTDITKEVEEDNEDADIISKPTKHVHKSHKHRNDGLGAFTAEEPVLSREVAPNPSKDIAEEQGVTFDFTAEYAPRLGSDSGYSPDDFPPVRSGFPTQDLSDIKREKPASTDDDEGANLNAFTAEEGSGELRAFTSELFTQEDVTREATTEPNALTDAFTAESYTEYITSPSTADVIAEQNDLTTEGPVDYISERPDSTPGIIDPISTEKLVDFTTETLADFTTETLPDLAPEQLVEFTSERLDDVATEKMAAFTTEIFNDYTSDINPRIAVTTESPATHTHTEADDIEALNNLIHKLSFQDKEDSYVNRKAYDNDIVISHGADSAEKGISKLFNDKARDIIELIQSSAEINPQRDCMEAAEKHDHKSYRLSFLFNK